MFTTIYNYITSFYYNSNKTVKINQDVWIKNQMILWQNDMYSKNPYLQNIPSSIIEQKKEYFESEYKKLFK